MRRLRHTEVRILPKDTEPESQARTTHSTPYVHKCAFTDGLWALQPGVCGGRRHGLGGSMLSSAVMREGNEALLISSAEDIVHKLCPSALIRFPVASNC